MVSKTLKPGEVLPTGDTAAPRRSEKARRSASGRFSVINAFVDVGLKSLTRSEISTWLVLWRDERHGIAKTSAGAISARAGMSRRSVAEALKSLRQRGMLIQVYRGGLNRGSSVYRLRPVGHEHEKPAST